MSNTEQKKIETDAFAKLCDIVDALHLNDFQMVIRRVKSAKEWLENQPRPRRGQISKKLLK